MSTSAVEAQRRGCLYTIERIGGRRASYHTPIKITPLRPCFAHRAPPSSIPPSITQAFTLILTRPLAHTRSACRTTRLLQPAARLRFGGVRHGAAQSLPSRGGCASVGIADRGLAPLFRHWRRNGAIQRSLQLCVPIPRLDLERRAVHLGLRAVGRLIALDLYVRGSLGRALLAVLLQYGGQRARREQATLVANGLPRPPWASAPSMSE